jgi:soluble lytic murein transglycosylase
MGAYSLWMSLVRRFFTLLCVFLVSTVFTVQPAQAASDFAELLFSPRRLLTEDLSTYRNHALYPWLQAAQFQAQWDKKQADFPALVAFLQTPQAASRDLRRQVLKDLADDGQWLDFEKIWLERDGNNATRCAYVQVLIGQERFDEAEQRLLALWDDRLDCDPALNWFRTRPTYERVVEGKLIEALRANKTAFARKLLNDVPRRQRYQNWLSLLDNPQSLLRLEGEILPEMVEAAILKIARKNPEGAQTLLDARDVGVDARNAGLRAIALGWAWSRDDRAIAIFQNLPEDLSDARVGEWRVRIALRFNRFDLAKTWLDRLPSDLAVQPRWRYWKARMLAVHGQNEAAVRLWQPLSRENSFYSLLAAQRLGQGYSPTPKTTPKNANLQRQLKRDPAIERALAAFNDNFKTIASAEWRYKLDDSTLEERQQMAYLASEAGWYDMMMWTANKADIADDLALLFPRPYAEIVDEASALTGIDEGWIYAVMRQESAYRADAASGAKAYGLLQLLLPTAKTTARRWKRAVPVDRNDLFQPSINVPLGAAYLRDQLDRWGGEHWPLLLGSYNAGPGAVRRWLPEGQAMEADIWIESIPFNETRDYVQRVSRNAAMYQWLEAKRAVNVSPWFSPIEAKNP